MGTGLPSGDAAAANASPPSRKRSRTSQAAPSRAKTMDTTPRARSTRASMARKSYVDLTEVDDEPHTPKKRKTYVDLTGESPKTPKKRKSPNKDEERRLKRHRTQLPTSLQVVKQRALTQRMFVVDRSRSGTDEWPEEVVQLAGTTGNVYTVKIGLVPSCDCPHAVRGNHCKHLFYVLARVLRAPDHLQYQAAYLSAELREIFATAPPIPSVDPTSSDGNRKPIEDDCPICCIEFEPEKEAITFCRAACGNNMHKACFDQWAASKKRIGETVTCPFCRTPWREDEGNLKSISASGQRTDDGYVNISEQLGISTRRDTSTYHRFQRWGRY